VVKLEDGAGILRAQIATQRRGAPSASASGAVIRAGAKEDPLFFTTLSPYFGATGRGIAGAASSSATGTARTRLDRCQRGPPEHDEDCAVYAIEKAAGADAG